MKRQIMQSSSHIVCTGMLFPHGAESSHDLTDIGHNVPFMEWCFPVNEKNIYSLHTYGTRVVTRVLRTLGGKFTMYLECVIPLNAQYCFPRDVPEPIPILIGNDLHHVDTLVGNDKMHVGREWHAGWMGYWNCHVNGACADTAAGGPHHRPGYVECFYGKSSCGVIALQSSLLSTNA